jgi:hypothetical protein
MRIILPPSPALLDLLRNNLHLLLLHIDDTHCLPDIFDGLHLHHAPYLTPPDGLQRPR